MSPSKKNEFLLNKCVSPPNRNVSPPNKNVSPPKKNVSPSTKNMSPPKKDPCPPIKETTSSKMEIVTPQVTSGQAINNFNNSSPKNASNAQAKETTVVMKAETLLHKVASPPALSKAQNVIPKLDNNTSNSSVLASKEPASEVIIKAEKVAAITHKEENVDIIDKVTVDLLEQNLESNEKETNGVGDKIKKFEKAAEDASVNNSGKLSRPGSVRGRSRSERLGSDSKDDYLPPATPFKDNVHFELNAPMQIDKVSDIQASKSVNFVMPEQQNNLLKKTDCVSSKWQKQVAQSFDADKIRKPEPQKIIKPEFKTIQSPVEVTIRSPSLGSKIADQFPSQGTAFRNVASPDSSKCKEPHKMNEDVNTQNNFKTCKFKSKEKYSVSKGSSYFTRGTEEIWLVKKKDIEEIEERVLDSFRRAGGNICMRNDSMRPSSDSGQNVSFSHATMGRTKRPMYTRSESLDPQSAGARSQTLKRQSSVACTCGHDKKVRAKNSETVLRPRSRSHGDENNQAHVLDKYETLV